MVWFISHLRNVGTVKVEILNQKNFMQHVWGYDSPK